MPGREYDTSHEHVKVMSIKKKEKRKEAQSDFLNLSYRSYLFISQIKATLIALSSVIYN